MTVEEKLVKLVNDLIILSNKSVEIELREGIESEINQEVREICGSVDKEIRELITFNQDDLSVDFLIELHQLALKTKTSLPYHIGLYIQY